MLCTALQLIVHIMWLRVAPLLRPYCFILTRFYHYFLSLPNNCPRCNVWWDPKRAFSPNKRNGVDELSSNVIQIIYENIWFCNILFFILFFFNFEMPCVDKNAMQNMTVAMYTTCVKPLNQAGLRIGQTEQTMVIGLFGCPNWPIEYRSGHCIFVDMVVYIGYIFREFPCLGFTHPLEPDLLYFDD